ncbi:MAG: LysM peptidoglycan-binding domain-containing protein [Eubacterium sp.]
MSEIRMKFGDFEFPSNPKVIKAEISSTVIYSPVYGGKSKTEKITDKPTVISGNGMFFSENAIHYCQRLSRMMKSKKSDWLFCPGVYPIKAFLSDFSYQLDSKNNGICYSFSFVEDCNKVSVEKKFLFTVAENDENAFDIADRCGVSVDDIMRFNDIATPFDIASGGRIRIRENSNDRY